MKFLLFYNKKFGKVSKLHFENYCCTTPKTAFLNAVSNNMFQKFSDNIWKSLLDSDGLPDACLGPFLVYPGTV
jgi:hypothetical protein